MNLTDIIAVVAIVAVIGCAIAYIVKEKKKGKKCIGCPYSCSCQSQKGKGGCGDSCASCDNASS